MKLYLIHTGYYDQSVGDGFFEQHTNIFVVAENVYCAREKVKENIEFIDKKMHIDGIKEIENVDGYVINVLQSKDSSNNWISIISAKDATTDIAFQNDTEDLRAPTDPIPYKYLWILVYLYKHTLIY